MGFSPELAQRAIQNAGEDVESAIQWIEQQQDKQDEQLREDSAEPVREEQQDAGPVVIERTVPLTEEQKAAKLEALRQRAAKRKEEQAKIDEEERKRNQELSKKKEKDRHEILDEMKKKQAMKDAQKRRKEAAEDAAAKQRIRDLIEADKRARKAQKEQASGNTSSPVSAATANASASASASKPQAPRADPTESKIRFRLPNSPQPLVKTYPIETTVKQVFEDIAPACGSSPERIQLKLTFPTRVITSSDFGKDLKEADLININAMVVIA